MTDNVNRPDDRQPDDEMDPDVERASEIEDFTGGTERPAGEAEPHADVEHDIDALLNERDSFKDIALRLQADFENYRKRVTAQRDDDIDRATGKMAESMLPVLDAFESAFLQHPAEVEPLFNLFLGELRKQGLETMDLLDKPFDPTVAEAVIHEPGDGDDTVVSEVLRSGYLWKGRVLRAAMVKVKG